MTISEPVERRLNGLLRPLEIVTTCWTPPLPMKSCVPKN